MEHTNPAESTTAETRARTPDKTSEPSLTKWPQVAQGDETALKDEADTSAIRSRVCEQDGPPPADAFEAEQTAWEAHSTRCQDALQPFVEDAPLVWEEDFGLPIDLIKSSERLIDRFKELPQTEKLNALLESQSETLSTLGLYFQVLNTTTMRADHAAEAYDEAAATLAADDMAALEQVLDRNAALDKKNTHLQDRYLEVSRKHAYMAEQYDALLVEVDSLKKRLDATEMCKYRPELLQQHSPRSVSPCRDEDCEFRHRSIALEGELRCREGVHDAAWATYISVKRKGNMFGMEERPSLEEEKMAPVSPLSGKSPLTLAEELAQTEGASDMVCFGTQTEQTGDADRETEHDDTEMHVEFLLEVVDSGTQTDAEAHESSLYIVIRDQVTAWPKVIHSVIWILRHAMPLAIGMLTAATRQLVGYPRESKWPGFPLPWKAVLIAMIHALLITVAYEWVLCHRERTIWLEANGMARLPLLQLARRQWLDDLMELDWDWQWDEPWAGMLQEGTTAKIALTALMCSESIGEQIFGIALAWWTGM